MVCVIVTKRKNVFVRTKHNIAIDPVIRYCSHELQLLRAQTTNTENALRKYSNRAYLCVSYTVQAVMGGDETDFLRFSSLFVENLTFSEVNVVL